MNARILILHGYSAENAGDGLLVRETLDIVREAAGEDAAITLLASRPETFDDLNVTAFPTVPTRQGWDARTRRVLRRIDEYDLVVAVGGGYLRAGTVTEALKTALVHGPQLYAAAKTSVPTVYLPQSIGPARYGTAPIFRRALRKLDSVMARDDRTIDEVGGPSVSRWPDLATAGVVGGRQPGAEVHPVPVVSIRAVHGKINPDIYELAHGLSAYDGYVQSTVGGNDDRPAAATLAPREMLRRDVLMTPGGQPRVVIAVRLHAALMALAAGHYVVHLAYERKGFGAFGDLGLDDWVHRVNHFDVATVRDQVERLLTEPSVRADYDLRIADARQHIIEARERIVRTLRVSLTGKTRA